MIDRLTRAAFVRRASGSIWNRRLPRTHISHLRVTRTTSGLLRSTGGAVVLLTTLVWRRDRTLAQFHVRVVGVSGVQLQSNTFRLQHTRVSHEGIFSLSGTCGSGSLLNIHLNHFSVIFSGEVGHRSLHGNKRH